MRILHVLDHSLPLHSGYTFRTRAIVTAQKARGMEVACLTGPATGAAGRTPRRSRASTFHRTPAPAAAPSPLREWREIRALDGPARRAWPKPGGRTSSTSIRRC